MTLCLDSSKAAKEEQPEAYATVTIDSKHKVSEHYHVLEKLGVWVSFIIQKKNNFQNAAERHCHM